jgi:soluble lytic murein transglycosylase-like protein
MRVFLSLSATLLISTYSYADIYKYVDENGVVFYTDTPNGQKAAKFIQSPIAEGTPAVIKAEKKPFKRNYSEIIHEKCRQYDVDPSLVKAMIKTESDYNPDAVSPKGAMGLMQLMPVTAREMGVYNPYNAEQNIEGGIKYIKYLLEKFNGNLTLALAAYNSGPTTVEKFGSVPPITETRQYVKKILTIYNKKDSTYTGIKTSKTEPIYKIVLVDGTILFTNSSLYASQPSSY